MGKVFVRSFIVLFLSAVIVGCGSKTDSTDSPLEEIERAPFHQVSLVSAFGFAPSNQAAAVVAFYSNQRYFSGVVQKINNQYYRMAATVGYYAEGDGVIEMTGKKTTCASWIPLKAKRTVVGSVNGQSLVVSAGAYSAVLSRIQLAAASAPRDGLLLETGCFDANTGAFTQSGWIEIN